MFNDYFNNVTNKLNYLTRQKELTVSNIVNRDTPNFKRKEIENDVINFKKILDSKRLINVNHFNTISKDAPLDALDKNTTFENDMVSFQKNSLLTEMEYMSFRNNISMLMKAIKG